jgi:tetratricopeptide (TPR) repeat protein
MRMQLLALTIGVLATSTFASDVDPFETWRDSVPFPEELAAGDPAEGGTGDLEAPEPLPGVLRATELGYLTDDERAERRIFHGLWLESDLDRPSRRAEAALILGIFDDGSLDDPSVNVEVRAEARVRRGDLQEALDLLQGVESMRASRLRAEAMEGLGRFDAAEAELAPIVTDTVEQSLDDALVLTEFARALVVWGRLRGEPAAHYQRITNVLTRAHQRIDRLSWPALLAEAELLFTKHNAREGTEAALEVLTRNPSSAGAYRLLGEWAVNTFDFERADVIADRLDSMARRLGDEDATHPYGDLIRARARLRLSDAPLAEALLGPTLRRYPRMREALALWCGARATRYDFERLDAMLDAFDALSPNSAEAYYVAGNALSEDRQYESAAKYLAIAHERRPRWPEPLIERGLMELQSGRDQEALEALTKAVELDPFNGRAVNSLQLIEELLTYDTVESEHFIVRYRPGVDAVMAREMLADLEEMHDVVVDAMGFEPERKTLIELMPDHEWFAVRITGMTRIHTIAASTGPVVAMEAPKIGKKHEGEYDWVRVVRHEYTHTVTLARTNNRIPIWFTEAAAVTMELAPRDFNRSAMLAEMLKTDGLLAYDELNTSFVRPKEPHHRSLAYAQSAWIWEYIVHRWGSEAPLEMMDAYAAGVRELDVIPTVLGLPVAEFMDDFKAWARGEVASWGLSPSPTIAELRLEETLADEELRDGVLTSLTDFAESVGIASTIGGGPEPMDLKLIDLTPELLDFWSVVHPDHPQILRLRIEEESRYTHDGRPDEGMIPLLERYAAACPVDDMPRRHLARLYLRSDEPEKAIEHLEFLDVRETQSEAYAVELAKRYAAIGAWEQAQAKAERATRVAPFDAGNRELAATLALKVQDFEAAERHIMALVDLEPQRDKHRQRLEALRSLRAGSG